MDSKAPVVIVGSGPSGLYVALALLQNGINVRIIEKDKEFHVGSRGAGLYPRTFEIQSWLGVLDDIVKYSGPFVPMRSYTPGPPEQAEILKTWSFVDTLDAAPATPYVTGRLMNQNVHEKVIRDHLKKYDCEVELGAELLGFEQDDKGVDVKIRHQGEGGKAREETIRASYLLGADGARGIIRKLLKLSFLGETKDSDGILVADVETKQLNSDFLHFWEKPKGDGSIRVFTRPFDAYSKTSPFHQIMLMGNFSEAEMNKFAADEEAFEEAFHKLSGRTDVKFESVLWRSYFRPNMRMVNKFGDGRVFVLGDAAHVHSPLGGQGMNSSIQDAINLSWKLALVLKDLAPSSLLDTFTEERLPVIAEMLRKTAGIYTLTYAEGRSEELAREREAWRRGGALFMLGINYRWSSITLEERDPQLGDKEKREAMIDEMKARAYGGYDNGLCAGDRAPEVPGLLVSRASAKSKGEETTLFKMLDLLKHTVLIFASSKNDQQVQEILAAISSIPEVKEVVQASIITRALSSTSGGDNDSSGSKATDRTKYDGVATTVIDRDGHAYNGYLVKDNEFTVVIIRPDGYIGAITKGKTGVVRYFDKIFLQ